MMRKITVILSVLAFCLLMAPVQDASATGVIRDAMLAEYPDMCDDLVALAVDCSMCHGGGFALNPYGVDLAGASNVFADIEGDDSDGDGRTNIEEISNDCTNPGDAVSAADPVTWSSIKVLFQ